MGKKKHKKKKAKASKSIASTISIKAETTQGTAITPRIWDEAILRNLQPRRWWASTPAIVDELNAYNYKPEPGPLVWHRVTIEEDDDGRGV
jgi:hypothetical protein